MGGLTLVIGLGLWIYIANRAKEKERELEEIHERQERIRIEEQFQERTAMLQKEIKRLEQTGHECGWWNSMTDIL